MHNIAEGCDAGTDAEFIRFLKIARRSASEVQSELYLALDRGYIENSDLNNASTLADEAKRLINGLIAYLRRSGQPAVSEASDIYTTEDDQVDYHQTEDSSTDDYQTNDYQTGS